MIRFTRNQAWNISIIQELVYEFQDANLVAEFQTADLPEALLDGVGTVRELAFLSGLL